MSTQLATRGSREIARPLSVLAPLIKQDIAEGNAAGSIHYRKAGEKLIEAKEQLGGFSPAYWEWVRRTFKGSNDKPLSPAQAKTWMDFSKAIPKDPAKPYTSLDDYRRRHLGEDVLTGSKRNRKLFGPAKAVLREVDVEALRQSAQSAAKERDMERTLYLQMIDIGFKILAVKLHSDKGGKDEAMARLNRVRARAKSLA
jgi:hypothetical protein